MTAKRGFASDNNSGFHPRIIKYLEKVNVGHEVGYGDDPHTREAEERFKKIFGSESKIFFVYGGTGANVVSLQAALNSFEGVVCAATAHINEDECGAPEKFTGSKLIDIPTADGKLNPEMIAPLLHSLGFEHQVQPKVISLTQATELGTVYTVEEVKALTRFARANKMLVQMDGARLANAAAYLGCSPAEFTSEAGVDIFSFGGTKNGMLIGEAIVVSNPELAANIKFIRKQSMQLFSKMRFISAQFLAVLENDLWLELAARSNRMAEILAGEAEKIPELEIVYPVQANGVFVRLPKDIIKPLREEYFFYVWNEEEGIARWMCSFDTTEEDIDGLISKVRELIGK